MLHGIKLSLAAGAFGLLAMPYTGALAAPVDGTAFLKSLIAKEIKNGEKKCRKAMKKTAKCKISIQKVLVTKAGEDTANIKIISNLRVYTKFLVKASADAEVIAKATYKIRTCEIDIKDVSRKITKLSGAAAYLEPFKKSITKIEVPTGVQPIKTNNARTKISRFLEDKLKLTSEKEAENCEKS
ncbi:MAG: hypothetical protein ACRBBN_02320 [Methyloligellaceae bacterium]